MGVQKVPQTGSQRLWDSRCTLLPSQDSSPAAVQAEKLCPHFVQCCRCLQQ